MINNLLHARYPIFSSKSWSSFVQKSLCPNVDAEDLFFLIVVASSVVVRAYTTSILLKLVLLWIHKWTLVEPSDQNGNPACLYTPVLQLCQPWSNIFTYKVSPWILPFQELWAFLRHCWSTALPWGSCPPLTSWIRQGTTSPSTCQWWEITNMTQIFSHQFTVFRLDFVGCFIFRLETTPSQAARSTPWQTGRPQMTHSLSKCSTLSLPIGPSLCWSKMNMFCQVMIRSYWIMYVSMKCTSSDTCCKVRSLKFSDVIPVSILVTFVKKAKLPIPFLQQTWRSSSRSTAPTCPQVRCRQQSTLGTTLAQLSWVSHRQWPSSVTNTHPHSRKGTTQRTHPYPTKLTSRRSISILAGNLAARYAVSVQMTDSL